MNWRSMLVGEGTGSYLTYATIPAIAMKTPITDLSPTARPDVIHPRATIEHVFTCPTTVLDTGPV